MTTQTTNLGLSKPDAGDADWAPEINANWDTLDAMAYVSTPIYLNMLTAAPDVVGQGTWGRAVYNLELHCGEFKNSSAADGDNFSVKFRCPAGTYALRANAPKHSDTGVVKVYVDGVQVGNSGGYDLYAASFTAISFLDVAGLVLSAGEHTLKFELSGKNGSSSAYTFRLSGINLRRTE